MFKEQRAQKLDKYIYQIKIQLMKVRLFKLIKLSKIIRTIASKYTTVQVLRKIRMNQRQIVMMYQVKFRIMFKKRQGIKNILLNKIRYAFTFGVGTMMAHQAKMCRRFQVRRCPFIEAPNITLKVFFENQKQVMLRSKIARFIRSITYMQNKLIAKYQVRDSKQKILEYYWDTTV